VRYFLLLLLLYLSILSLFAGKPYSSTHPKLEFLFCLPDEITESSGLIWFQGLFWTFNDSGGRPVIYGLDKETGKIMRKVILANASHVDWEEIAQDEEYIYVGDFGNNFGNRKDLKIYRVAKSGIPNSTKDINVQAEIISFSFSDQSDFRNALLFTPYDCEAMVVWGDSLMILSKDWVNEISKVYYFPKKPGNYNVQQSFVFRSRGLVTGAAMNVQTRELALCGYEEFTPFVWLIYIENKPHFSHAPRKRKTFYRLGGVQTEGICFGPDGYLYLTSEKSRFKQALYRLNPSVLRRKH
jgi:hypothetical protein